MQPFGLHSIYMDLDISKIEKLLHFLEVYILGAVVAVVVGSGLRSGLLCAGLGLCLGVEDVLLGGSEGCLAFLDGGIDSFDILSFVCFLELGYCGLNGALLVGGDLVSECSELFLGLEDDGVGLVEFVYALFLFGVC